MDKSATTLKFETLSFLLEQFGQDKSVTSTMNIEEKHTKATEIVHSHVGFALGAALIPLPGVDLLAVTGVQLNMLRALASLYNVGFLDTLGKNIISAVAGGGAARLGASIIKVIPGIGTIIGELSMPVLSGASTYALGRVVAKHFRSGGTLDNLDLKSARRGYKKEIEIGKKMAETLRQPTAEGPLDKLRKMAELHQSGVITDEEFQRLKERLLAQV